MKRTLLSFTLFAGIVVMSACTGQTDWTDCIQLQQDAQNELAGYTQSCYLNDSPNEAACQEVAKLFNADVDALNESCSGMILLRKM